MEKLNIINRKPYINSDSKICATCIYDENVPAIEFDENGICNYCKMIDNLKDQYHTGTPEGVEEF